MSRPGTPNNAVCPNSDCKYHLKVKYKNIRKQGKNSAGHQRYQCMHCKKYFVETSNTPMYHRHISEEELIHIGRLLIDKSSNRAISRKTGLTLVTVSRVIDAIIQYAVEFNKMMKDKVSISQDELDEMWIFIEKNKKKWTHEQRTKIL